MNAQGQDTRKRRTSVGVEIGVQVLLVLALGIWLLQGRPWGYAPEWSLRVHAPWSWMRLWRVLSLMGILGGLGGWWARGLKQRDSPASLPSESRPSNLAPRQRDPERTGRARVIAALLVLCLLAMVLQGGLHGLADLSVPLLVASSWSTVGTEYFRTAYEIREVGIFLRNYPHLMRQAQYHVATHPPGAVLFYWVGIRTLEQIPALQDLFLDLAERWSGMSPAEIAHFSQQFPSAADLPRAAIPAILLCTFLLMLAGSSGVIPVYLLARLGGDRRMGLLAAACFCTVPSFLLFFQSLDQLVLMGTLWTVYLFLVAIQRKRFWLFSLAGVIWGLTLFVSLGTTALGALLGIYLASLTWQRRHQEAWLKGGIRFALFLLGAVGWWGFIALLGSFSPLQVIHQGLAAHARVTTVEFPRTYAIWVWLNGVDWAVFLGLPFSVWWVRSLWAAVRGEQTGLPAEGAHNPGLGELNLVLAFTWLALDLSGQVRAEVGRIWLFMMPLAVVGLVHWLYESAQDSSEDGRLWAWRLGTALGLQIVQVVLMALTMTPLVLPF